MVPENQEDRNIINSAMYGGSPLKSYIKTILGKVYVTVWDSFTGGPEGVILFGDPRKGDDTCVVDIWTEEEDYYFRTKNKRHLQTGDVILYTRKTEVKERTVEEFTDEELTEILNKKYFALQNVLNSTTSVAVLFRIRSLAEKLEKSDKIMSAIDGRISEVQAEEYKPVPNITLEL